MKLIVSLYSFFTLAISQMLTALFYTQAMKSRRPTSITGLTRVERSARSVCGSCNLVTLIGMLTRLSPFSLPSAFDEANQKTAELTQCFLAIGLNRNSISSTNRKPPLKSLPAPAHSLGGAFRRTLGPQRWKKLHKSASRVGLA